MLAGKRSKRLLEVESIMEVTEITEIMTIALTNLGLSHWRVSWLPDSSCKVRGRIIPEKLLIEIFDLDEAEAWTTFIHEVIEIELRSSLRPYRILVNKLIEGYQDIVDGEKDRFIETLPILLETIKKSRTLTF